METDFQSALIVDDEDSIRYFLSECLGDFGFECLEASDAKEALNVLGSRGFDLLMLDVRMPGMNGLELLREIRERGVGARVVMLSAVGDPEVAARALTSLGVDAFISKPCTLDELQSTIENLPWP